MADKNVFLENLAVLTSPEGFQKYLLGTKKSGQPRAVYDIVKDYTQPKRRKKGKKKNKHKSPSTSYSFYLDTKKKKKKKGKKKNKYWHI